MSHLKVLDLKDNKIKELPDDISKMEQLIRLDVSNNELNNLPNNLGFLSKLQSLRVEGNKIRSIRRDIIQCGTVRILKFLRERFLTEQLKTDSTNQESISNKTKVQMDNFPTIYVMKSTRALNLIMKELTDVPHEVFDNAKEANVTTIDLCRNKFKEMPSRYVT